MNEQVTSILPPDLATLQALEDSIKAERRTNTWQPRGDTKHFTEKQGGRGVTRRKDRHTGMGTQAGSWHTKPQSALQGEGWQDNDTSPEGRRSLKKRATRASRQEGKKEATEPPLLEELPEETYPQAEGEPTRDDEATPEKVLPPGFEEFAQEARAVLEKAASIKLSSQEQATARRIQQALEAYAAGDTQELEELYHEAVKAEENRDREHALHGGRDIKRGGPVGKRY